MTVWSQLVAAPTLAFANLSAAALYLNHFKSDTNHSFGRKRDVHRGVTRLQIKETSFHAAGGLVSPRLFPSPNMRRNRQNLALLADVAGIHVRHDGGQLHQFPKTPGLVRTRF